MYATQVALECRMIAQAWGHNPGETVLGAPQLYLFEPHQTEQMGWKPDTFLDITPVWEKKRAAIDAWGPGAPLGLLHPRRPEPRQPLQAQLGRPGGRARLPVRRRVPVGLSAHRAHLGHVELLTDRFDESLDFFTRVYGLKLSAQEGDSAYLRAWDDYEFHSLKLTATTPQAWPMSATAPRRKRRSNAGSRPSRHGLRHRLDRRR
jgi:hypothetical protein